MSSQGQDEGRATFAGRIAVVGCGQVGATSAYALLLGGLAREIVLVDMNREAAEGHAMDLSHAVPLAMPVSVWAGDYEDAAGAAIAVISAGVAGRPGESRLDLLGRNAVVIRSCVSDLMRNGFDGVILMTTNPVDVLAQIAQEESGLPAGRVISSGTVLDTSRLRALLGEALGVDARSIHAYVLGEHGDSELAAWSSARVGGVPLRDFPGGADLDYTALLAAVRTAAPEIIARKGYTSFAIGSSVARICRAILRDERTILAVSTMTTGQYGIEGVYLSLPCVVGADGVERVLELPLDDVERRQIEASAEILRRSFAACKKN